MQRVIAAIRRATSVYSWDAVVALLRIFGVIIIVRLVWRIAQPFWDDAIREDYAQFILGVPGILALLVLIYAGLLAAIVWGINRRLDTLEERTAS